MLQKLPSCCWRVLQCITCIGVGSAFLLSSEFIYAGCIRISSNSSGCPASGVYTGIGQGMHGEIVVQVICERNRITKIDILQHHETPMISDSACSEIPSEIIRDQKVDVDAVSGATYTSNGIKEAVRNALQKAVSK